MGNLLDRLRKAFVLTTLHAAMADAPAVMTASGWKYDDKGNLYQDKKAFEKGAPEERLRNNLAVLGGVTLAATAVPVVLPALDAALAPTARAMYNPYSSGTYKTAAKRFASDLGLGMAADEAAGMVGYDWQALTGLPEYVADLTDPLYWAVDRYLDLGPNKVGKLVKETVKDGVKKGVQKVKETATDLFEPLPAIAYKLGGTVNRFKYK